MPDTLNNFDLIKDLLSFHSTDDFYFVQILKRKKDNPDMEHCRNNSSRCIKTYYIKSKEKLEYFKDTIVNICNVTNSRAYIHLTKRSFKKVGVLCLQDMLSHVAADDYSGMYKSYNSACGHIGAIQTGTYFLPNLPEIPIHKLWVVDLDAEHLEDERLYRELTAASMVWEAKNWASADTRKGIVAEIPTVSGKHLITLPFNTHKFSQDCVIHKVSVPDIQKNNPTLLYYKSIL